MFGGNIILKILIMLKNILNLKNAQTLSKDQQKSVNGGNLGACPNPVDAQKCQSCGGYPLPNGCCLGTRETHMCISGIFE